jgi:protein involved in polysaccharide export with SLBB domain
MRALVKAAGTFGLLFSLAVPCTLHAQDALQTAPGRGAQMAPYQTQAAAAPAPQASSVAGITDYVLGVGDKMQLTVFGEDDLSGEFQVSSTGMVSLPLIGDVRAAGQTMSQVQDTITRKLAEGYMKSPHVSLQVSSYRPFFIVGEVMKPGSYTYVNGMSVINAVALAGGYTYRADKDDIKLKHGGPGAQDEKAGETTAVVPGDVITVPERFF